MLCWRSVCVQCTSCDTELCRARMGGPVVTAVAFVSVADDLPVIALRTSQKRGVSCFVLLSFVFVFVFVCVCGFRWCHCARVNSRTAHKRQRQPQRQQPCPLLRTKRTGLSLSQNKVVVAVVQRLRMLPMAKRQQRRKTSA